MLPNDQEWLAESVREGVRTMGWVNSGNSGWEGASTATNRPSHHKYKSPNQPFWLLFDLQTKPTKRQKNCSRTTSGSSNELQPAPVVSGGGGVMGREPKWD